MADTNAQKGTDTVKEELFCTAPFFQAQRDAVEKGYQDAQWNQKNQDGDSDFTGFVIFQCDISKTAPAVPKDLQIETGFYKEQNGRAQNNGQVTFLFHEGLPLIKEL